MRYCTLLIDAVGPCHDLTFSFSMEELGLIYVNIQEKNSPVVRIMRFVRWLASGGNAVS